MKDLPNYRSIPEDKYLEMERRMKQLEDENVKLIEGASVVYHPSVYVVDNSSWYNKLDKDIYEIMTDTPKFKEEDLYKDIDKNIKEVFKNRDSYYNGLSEASVKENERVTSTLEEEYKERWLKCKKELKDKNYRITVFSYMTVIMLLCYFIWR